jgi:effector-binding domain-containing protein
MKTNNTPKVNEFLPINFLFHRAETKLADLANFIPVAKDLFHEAVRLNLQVSGPVHWHYFGFTGDASQPFTLEVALPVNEIPAEYDGAFHFKRTEKFKCATITHEGGWMEIPQSYAELMQFMDSQQLQPIGVTRELYVNADFVNPEANVTEIQMGIK